MTYDELVKQIKLKQSFLCIGLDPDIQKIPEHLLGDKDALFQFCKQIVDKTHDLAVAYKPNIAFFESYGSDGILSLEKLIEYIKTEYPDIFTIIDAKRADIGNTAQMYAYSVFERMDFDAVTLSPYMGKDSLMPFLSNKNKWSIILALTSNSGSEDFQRLNIENGESLYEVVIKKCVSWAGNGNMMFVVGATALEEFINIRKIAPMYFLLIPGIGTQGGSLENVCKLALNKDCGILINSSRDIIYADSSINFANKAREEAFKLQQKMCQILKERNIIN